MSAPHILVDADACPVVRQVEDAARKFGLPMTLLCDEHHLMHSNYARVRHVSSGADAVDIALMLMERHLAKKARRASGKHHLRGPAKFTEDDRQRFSAAFEELISLAIQASGGNET